MRQCLAANMFKFFHDKCPLYMKDVFDKSCRSQASTRNSTMKLSQPLRRTSYGQHCVLFSSPSVWNNLLNELKLCINLNTSKHKIKEYILWQRYLSSRLDPCLHNSWCFFSLILVCFCFCFFLFCFVFLFFCILPYLSLPTLFKGHNGNKATWLHAFLVLS